MNHQQTPKVLSDFEDSPAATRGDFSLQSHEQIKHRICERRRKLTNFSYSHRRPSRTSDAFHNSHKPPRVIRFHAQNLSRSNGSERSWALIQKLKRKKVTKVFSENRIKLNIQHGHKPSFISSLNGKVFDIFLSTRPDFHPNDLSWTGKGRDPPRWLHKWRHKFSTGHEKSLTENFFLFLWFCHH